MMLGPSGSQLMTIKTCHEKTCFLHMRLQMRRFAVRLELCGNRAADQRLRFRYLDSTISLLSNSEISSL